MRIGKVILDTDNMTYEEVDQLVQELREIRKRKGFHEFLAIRLFHTILV